MGTFLDPGRLLLASWGPLPALTVDEINERTAIVAGRYLYASENAAAIARLAHKYPDSAPRIMVQTKHSGNQDGHIELTIATSGLREGGRSQLATTKAGGQSQGVRMSTSSSPHVTIR